MKNGDKISAVVTVDVPQFSNLMFDSNGDNQFASKPNGQQFELGVVPFTVHALWTFNYRPWNAQVNFYVNGQLDPTQTYKTPTSPLPVGPLSIPDVHRVTFNIAADPA